MAADGKIRISRLGGLLVVAAWIALAVAANVILALSAGTPRDTGTWLPNDVRVANDRVAQFFPGTGTDAIAYLVFDGRELGTGDQQSYQAAVSALRADTAHVGAVLDWWSDPLTAPLGAAPDGHSAVAPVWLRGEAGTIRATESLDAARSTLRAVPVSAGLRARITTPAATASPLHLAAWQAAAIVAAAALVAALVVVRTARSVRPAAIALLCAGLSLAVAWPLLSGSPVFAVTLAAVLSIGTLTASVLLVGRREPGGYRDALPALALPGVCVAACTVPLLAARTAAHSVGLASLGVVVALAASLTLLPALIGIAGTGGDRPSAPPSGSGRVPRPAGAGAVAVAAVLAVCALPIIGAQWGVSAGPAGAARGAAPFVPSSRLPDVLVLKSDHDLRDPAGLIAIDAVSRRLMELPGVRKVQSAAWPAGVPWSDASLSAAAGRLSDQLDRQAATFVPQVTAIKTLATVLDQVSGSVDELEASVTAGVGGLAQLQQAIDAVVSGTRNVKDTANQVSGYLDPVRGWMGSVEDCTANALCSAARKAVDPFDRVIADVAVLSAGADRIAAGSARATGALSSTPHAVAQMRSALSQLRSFVPTLQTTVESTIPQVVQLSAFLKNLGTDFAGTGQGGFYLPRKELTDPSYQHVRQTMFSADGTATRLFVYSDATALDLDAAARAPQLRSAVDSATKYGSLLDSEITVSGAAQLAAAVRAAVVHDAVLLGLLLLVAVLLVSARRGARGGLAVGFGLLGGFLTGLGVTAAVWQYLLGWTLDISVTPLAFAVLAAFGAPYRAVAPLTALGAVFGGGLILVTGGSLATLGQLGTVVVVGLAATALIMALVDVDRLVPLRQGDLHGA